MILASPYRAGTRDFNTFREGGIEIFNFFVRFPWTGPDKWDFSQIHAKLDEYRSIDPKPLWLPRILLTPGNWFGEMYPDEITRRDNGTPAGMFGQGTHPSFASAKYRELSHKLMIAFITHLEEKYGDNIVGYQVGNLFGGGWPDERDQRRWLQGLTRQGQALNRETPGSIEAAVQRGLKTTTRDNLDGTRAVLSKLARELDGGSRSRVSGMRR